MQTTDPKVSTAGRKAMGEEEEQNYVPTIIRRTPSSIARSESSSTRIYSESNNKSTEGYASSQIEIYAGESPPVDESFFFDNLDALRHLKIGDTNVMNLISSSVSPADMKVLLEMEKGNVPEARDGKLFPQFDEKFKSTAFLWACFRNLSHLLYKLEASGANIHSVSPDGSNAISIASFAGNLSCLKYLIERGVDVNHINVQTRRTCLHAAAVGNSSDATKLLLDSGAKLHLPIDQDTEPVLHSAIRSKSDSVVKLLLERGADATQKNNLGETPLHTACWMQSVNCCEMLLSNLYIDVNAVDQMHRTPLHYAVMNMKCDNKLIELLLKHGALVNVLDETGFSPLHIAALNEQSECVEILIWNGADLSITTAKGVSALKIILRKMPESLNAFRQKLDASIRLKRPASQNREFEMRLDFGPLLPSNSECETKFIDAFIQENQKDFLVHPLVTALLYLKWTKIRKFYIVRIFTFTATVIFMSTYALTALAYKCHNFPETNNSKICNSSHFMGFLFHKSAIEVEWYLWLILTCCSMPPKVMCFIACKSVLHFFSFVNNILETIVLISVFATSFIYTGSTYDWQNYVGAFVTLCAWTNLMLLVGQLPDFGLYVAMFTHIQFEFAKLLLAYFGLLVGFTVSFCLIYVGKPFFGNPFTGLIKVLAMMAGELDYDGLITQVYLKEGDASLLHHPLTIFSLVLFTVFIIVVAVILMNLLVGIAVHDIQGLKQHAYFNKLVHQVKVILYIEQVLSKFKISFFQNLMPDDDKIETGILNHFLTVKPLNPLEKRLPKCILKQAYELARKNDAIVDDDDQATFNEHNTWMKKQNEDKESEFPSNIEKISLQLQRNEGDIYFVKAQLQDVKTILEIIMDKVS